MLLFLFFFISLHERTGRVQKEKGQYKRWQNADDHDVHALHIDPKQGAGVKESKININQLDNGQGIWDAYTLDKVDIDK